MAGYRTAGLLLAAGAGRRMGMPKALVRWQGQPLLLRALRALTDGGCAPVRVVLGAEAATARELLPDPGIAVCAADWASGMAASLRTGLEAVGALTPPPDAVLVHLVDLPDVDAATVSRMAALAAPDVVARATYHGEFGHPVVLGRRWWDDIAASLRGDSGARGWLAGRDDLRLVECSDLAGGSDMDYPVG